MSSANSPANLSLDDAFAEASPSLRGGLILAVCLLATATEGYDFQSMSMAAPLLARLWRLTPQGVGTLLTASVAGVVAGSLFFAPLGDRFGRRPCALVGLLIAAIFTAAGALAPDSSVLLATRALAGLGIGLATPNINAIAMETAPLRLRAFAIVLVSCGYPLGSGLGAGLASGLAPAYGYKAIFVLGAAATAAILLAVAAGLPESPYVLARNPARRDRLRRLLIALTGQPPVLATEHVRAPASEPQRSKIAALFTRERGVTTLLLWLLNFLGFAMLYFFISWLPSLLANRGLSPAAALRAIGLFNAGGVVGALLFAACLRIAPAASVLSVAYAAAAGAVVALSRMADADGAFMAAVAVAGGAIIGSQFCLTAVVNEFYPANIRVSAGGYAAGVGRLGAVVAPMAGALAVSLIASSNQVFLVTAAPSVVALAAALTLWASGGLRRAASPL